MVGSFGTAYAPKSLYLRQSAMKSNYKSIIAALFLLALPTWFLTLGMSPNVPNAGPLAPVEEPALDTARPAASVLRTAQPMAMADTLVFHN